MMVLMVAAVSPLPWQVHAHVYRVRPVTWKQMKGMLYQCLSNPFDPSSERESFLLEKIGRRAREFSRPRGREIATSDRD